jgi:BON domain
MRRKNVLEGVFAYGLSVLAVALICISPGLAGATARDDDSLKAQVKSALAADPSLSKHQITVYAFNGRVQLTGFVDNQKEEMKAVELARSLEMVKSVQDDLMIEEGPGPHIIPRYSNWQSAGP